MPILSFRSHVLTFCRFERAFNDMLFLCEKYAPLESLERYDPNNDISATGNFEAYDINEGV